MRCSTVALISSSLVKRQLARHDRCVADAAAANMRATTSHADD